MIKKLLIPIIVLFSGTAVFAQNDTLLYEPFDVDNTANYALFNSGNDTIWVNFDSDGLPDANARPQEWFWSPGGLADVDSVDACLMSSSWLLNLVPGNRNYLITPPITIPNGSFNLSWASAPRQTPRFLDGYSVIVSTTDNFEASFTDTLFQAAQFIAGNGTDFSLYTFSPGFVHGMDGTYIQLDANNDSTRYIGELRPFSVSLAQYSGQTIYISFLHDSDDDNLLVIDDILVNGTLTGIAETPVISGLTVYPNPASDKIELSYRLPVTGPVAAEIYDLAGRKVASVNRGIQIHGSQKLAIDVSMLAKGSYTVVLNANGNIVTSGFVLQ